MQQAVVYSVTDATLALLAKEFGTVPDCTTAPGYETARKAIGVCRTYRVEVEKTRKELKAEAIEYGRRVDGEAKRITEAILAVETPLKEAKEAEDNKAKIIEQARVDAIRARIQVFRSICETPTPADPTEIKELISQIGEETIDDSYQEFKNEATTWHKQALALLDAAYKAALYDQAERARRAEEEAQQAAAREAQAKANAIEAARLKAEREELDRISEAQAKEVAAERAAQAARQAELDRQQAEIARREKCEADRKAAEEAKAKAEADKQAKAAANKKLQAKLEGAAADAMSALYGDTFNAAPLITAIRAGKIPHVMWAA